MITRLGYIHFNKQRGQNNCPLQKDLI